MKAAVKHDMVLLKKIFAQGEMTTIEVSEMFEICVRKAGELRKECGFITSKHLKCNVCLEDRAVNCFNSKHSGICIKCRRIMGIEKQYGRHGGRPKTEAIPTIRSKCLKREPARWFLSPVGYDGKALHHICPFHQKMNKWLGEDEGFYADVNHNILRYW